jgi:hypothetical protein
MSPRGENGQSRLQEQIAEQIAGLGRGGVGTGAVAFRLKNTILFQ